MKVAIFGWYHKTDEKFFDSYTKQNLTIFPYQQIYNYGPDHDVWQQCQHYDLIIFPSFGLCSDWMSVNLPSYKKTLSRLPKTVWWSFDSHHDKYEYLYRSYFNEWLIFHSNCESHTGPDAIQLTPFFYPLSFDDVIKYTSKTNDKTYDVVFHHRRHTVGDRNTTVKKIEDILIEKNLSYNFNVIDSHTDYIQSICSAKIGLNLSVMNDINFRAFETWITDVPLLTNYLEDYKKLPHLFDQTTFYQSDLSDFSDKIDVVLSKKVNTRSHIIKNHMMMKRYIEAINVLSKTSFNVIFPDV